MKKFLLALAASTTPTGQCLVNVAASNVNGGIQRRHENNNEHALLRRSLSSSEITHGATVVHPFERGGIVLSKNRHRRRRRRGQRLGEQFHHNGRAEEDGYGSRQQLQEGERQREGEQQEETLSRRELANHTIAATANTPVDQTMDDETATDNVSQYQKEHDQNTMSGRNMMDKSPAPVHPETLANESADTFEDDILAINESSVNEPPEVSEGSTTANSSNSDSSENDDEDDDEDDESADEATNGSSGSSSDASGDKDEDGDNDDDYYYDDDNSSSSISKDESAVEHALVIGIGQTLPMKEKRNVSGSSTSGKSGKGTKSSKTGKSSTNESGSDSSGSGSSGDSDSGTSSDEKEEDDEESITSSEEKKEDVGKDTFDNALIIGIHGNAHQHQQHHQQQQQQKDDDKDDPFHWNEDGHRPKPTSGKPSGHVDTQIAWNSSNDWTSSSSHHSLDGKGTKQSKGSKGSGKTSKGSKGSSTSDSSGGSGRSGNSIESGNSADVVWVGMWPPTRHPTRIDPTPRPTAPTATNPTAAPERIGTLTPTVGPESPATEPPIDNLEPTSRSPTKAPSITSVEPTKVPTTPPTSSPIKLTKQPSNPPTPTPTNKPTNQPSTPQPTTSKPTRSPGTFPPLIWKGMNGCSPTQPCDICQGDCDTDEDCLGTYKCFNRSDGTQVPGCAVGGPGDIPGADYCYDPNGFGGPTGVPTMGPVGTLEPTMSPNTTPTTPSPVTKEPTSSPSLPVPPTMSPTNSIMPSSAMPTSSPTASTAPTTELPPLTWKGVNGCTPTTPCDACTGDCDSDEDCLSAPTNFDNGVMMGSGVVVVQLACYKRADGESPQVPGCAVGGSGDVPGADYCYDVGLTPKITGVPTEAPISTEPPTTDKPTERPTTRRPSASPTIAQDRDDPTQSPTPDEILTKPPSNAPSKSPMTNLPTTAPIPGMTIPPSQSPQVTTPPPTASPQSAPITSAPTDAPVGRPNNAPSGAPQAAPEAYFIRSQARTLPSSSGMGLSRNSPYLMFRDGDHKAVHHSNDEADEIAAAVAATDSNNNSKTRNLQEEPLYIEWCASGALSPDYYNLLLEACTSDSSITSMTNLRGGFDSDSIVRRMEQMDQLWSMDDEGYIHSIFDYERCMMVPSSGISGDDAGSYVEAPVEIGPCNDPNALNQFYYEDSPADRNGDGPNTLKLRGYDAFCVTFLGGEVATRGAPMFVVPCSTTLKFGWDFVPESELGEDRPTGSPTVYLPRLRYQGRDACTVEFPCEICTGDCDIDEDCAGSFECFQRERDNSLQVPGCAVGGPGDIPGADYCYDPNGGPPPPTTPAPTRAPTAAPQLTWLGGEGCTMDSPCPTCTGDCDEDADCRGLLVCFKRPLGENMQVPGCSVGGSGDIPGGDYCHDPDWEDALRVPPPMPDGGGDNSGDGALTPFPSGGSGPSKPLRTPRPTTPPDVVTQSSLARSGTDSKENVQMRDPMPVAEPESNMPSPSKPMPKGRPETPARTTGPSSSASPTPTTLAGEPGQVTTASAGVIGITTRSPVSSNLANDGTSPPSSKSSKESSRGGTNENSKSNKSPTAEDDHASTGRTRDHATWDHAVDNHASTRWERDHPDGLGDKKATKGTRADGTTRWEREHSGEQSD